MKRPDSQGLYRSASTTRSPHIARPVDLGPEADAFLAEASDFLRGGKRLRAQFTALGYGAVRPLNVHDDPWGELGIVLDAACALELFHAAALIHDDVIDRSETRRGRPALHRRFSQLHREQHLRQDPDHFGLSSAIVLGDLLQSWADELFQRACDNLDDRSAARQARAHFNRMRSEVAVGQYLDVLEEQQPEFAPEDEQLGRSTRVLVYKSAKYSVEAPLLIGAALAGANEEQEAALAAFGLPVGVAFQLRDDLLGVFGEPSVTGKPAGDDLAEGKRTVLVTLAYGALPATQQRLFRELLGDPGLDAEQIHMLQRTIRDSGASERVEEMINRNVDRANAALKDAPVREDALVKLRTLAVRASQRSS